MELPFQTLDELKNQQFESWPMQGGKKGGIKKYLQMNLINDSSLPLQHYRSHCE